MWWWGFVFQGGGGRVVGGAGGGGLSGVVARVTVKRLTRSSQCVFCKIAGVLVHPFVY